MIGPLKTWIIIFEANNATSKNCIFFSDFRELYILQIMLKFEKIGHKGPLHITELEKNLVYKITLPQQWKILSDIFFELDSRK